MIDRRKIREHLGHTRDQQVASADAWFALAKSFHSATQVLDEFSERIPSDTRPFALNAALSLELIFKGILAKKSEPIPDGAKGHELVHLCERANIGLSKNQKITLELLTETIVWAGRYPGPKTNERWNEYHDRIVEKHIVRSNEGNVYKVMANRETFPDWNNYQKIWCDCVAEFETGS